MPAKQETRSGLQYGWNYGENGWNTGMDSNLLFLGRFGIHLSVRSRQVSDPATIPGPTLVAGATYIVAFTPPPEPAEGEEPAAPTPAKGPWAGHENQVALWDGAAWVFGIPRTGWMTLIEDEDKVSVFRQAQGWSLGNAL